MMIKYYITISTDMNSKFAVIHPFFLFSTSVNRERRFFYRNCCCLSRSKHRETSQLPYCHVPVEEGRDQRQSVHTVESASFLSNSIGQKIS